MKRWIGMALMLLSHAAGAQELRVTNAAGGLACYGSEDLLMAHSALGFHETQQVERMILQERCFIMQEHWKPRIVDERAIGGVTATMVYVVLDNSGLESRRAWSLLKNFDFIGD